MHCLLGLLQHQAKPGNEGVNAYTNGEGETEAQIVMSFAYSS